MLTAVILASPYSYSIPVRDYGIEVTMASGAIPPQAGDQAARCKQSPLPSPARPGVSHPLAPNSAADRGCAEFVIIRNVQLLRADADVDDRGPKHNQRWFPLGGTYLLARAVMKRARADGLVMVLTWRVADLELLPMLANYRQPAAPAKAFHRRDASSGKSAHCSRALKMTTGASLLLSIRVARTVPAGAR
jgi:hypothetical protein